MIKYLKPFFYFSNLSTIYQLISKCNEKCPKNMSSFFSKAYKLTVLQKAKQWSELLMQMGESPRSTIAPEFNGSSQTETSVLKKKVINGQFKQCPGLISTLRTRR